MHFSQLHLYSAGTAVSTPASIYIHSCTGSIANSVKKYLELLLPGLYYLIGSFPGACATSIFVPIFNYWSFLQILRCAKLVSN